jgi:hypothetical protein
MKFSGRRKNTPPALPQNANPNPAGDLQSDLEVSQNAVEQTIQPTGLQPEEIVSAPQQLLSATTLAEGSATGVPQEAIGYLGQAGVFFSALIGGLTGAQILAGIALLGSLMGGGLAVYLYAHHTVLSPKQVNSLSNLSIAPNSDETLRELAHQNRDAQPSQAASDEVTPDKSPKKQDVGGYVDPNDNDAMDQLGFMVHGEQYFDSRPSGSWERFKSRHPDYDNFTWNAYSQRERAAMKLQDIQIAHAACAVATQQRSSDLEQEATSNSSRLKDCDSIKDADLRDSCLSSARQFHEGRNNDITKRWEQVTQQNYCGNDAQLSQMLDKKYWLNQPQ